MESLLELNERASLREFLVDRFSLDELKNLAFDLGVDYESFPQKAADVLVASQLHGTVDSENRLISIVAFDSLDEVSQNAWRLVSLYLPSLRVRLS